MTALQRHGVLDPQTGEVLAIVHGPMMEPHQVRQALIGALRAHGFEVVEERIGSKPGGRTTLAPQHQSPYRASLTGAGITVT